MIDFTPNQPASTPTLREYYENVYVRLKLRGAADATKKHYDYCLRNFDTHLNRPALISDLTDEEVSAAMGYFTSKGLGPRSANKFRDCILALWRFLARKRIVDQFPDVDELVEPKRIPVAWTPEELAKLWLACDSSLGMIGDVPANLWWHALHCVVWDSAERITAAVNILATDVDLKSGRLLVRAELRKGKRADKNTRLHPDTVALLRKIIAPDRERVFPWPHTASYLWNSYTRLLKLAGLPHDRYHKFHCLRKSVASYFKAAGGDATWLLGHTSTAVTAKYLDPDVIGEQHAADVLFRPMEISEPTNSVVGIPGEQPSQVLKDPRRVVHEVITSEGARRQPEADINLLEAIGEFQSSNCWYGKNAVYHRNRATYRLRAVFDTCNMTTAANLAALPIENYLRSLLASRAAAKTVCEYAQDITMFIRWLVNAKLAFGVRPELGRIVGIDAWKLVQEHAQAGQAAGGTSAPGIKLRGSGPRKRKPNEKHTTARADLASQTQGGTT
jgi:site-specific recombinase XerD